MSKPQVNLDYQTMTGEVTFLEKTEGPFGVIENWVTQPFEIDEETVFKAHEFMAQHVIEIAGEAAKESEAA